MGGYKMATDELGKGSESTGEEVTGTRCNGDGGLAYAHETGDGWARNPGAQVFLGLSGAFASICCRPYAFVAIL